MMIDPATSNEDLEAWLADLEAGNGTYDPSNVLPALNKAADGNVVGEHHSIPPTPTGQEGEEPDDEEEEPDPGADPNANQPPPEGETEPVEGVDYFTVNGNRFAREDIERLYNFDQALRANPDMAQRVAQAVQPPTPPGGTGQPPVPQATPPATPPTSEPPVPVDEYKDPEPPEFLDLEDPAQKFMWEQHVSTQRALHDRDVAEKQRWASIQAERQQAVERQAQTDMASALDSFKKSHPNLNDEEVAKIRVAAVPFVEGMMKQLSPVDALVRSMEVAGYSDNDLRPKLLDATQQSTTSHQRSTRRKAKLGQVAGTPRSAPKTESRVSYTSDKDMVNELARAFAEQGFGNN